MQGLVPRIVQPIVEASIATTPVVVLEGGRAVGKSTLCDALVAKNGWQPRLDLSDSDTLALLHLDPKRFLSQQSVPCIIDEAQLVPELPIWVKHLVDQRQETGQFLLTGSARLGRHQLGGSDPLAGRAVRHRMWSLTRGEIAIKESNFIGFAFGDGWLPATTQGDSTSVQAMLRGGLPGVSGVLTGESMAETGSQWEREMAAYVEGVIPLGAVNTRADLGRLLRTFRYFAANSGQILNIARAANDLGLQANTVGSHLDLLEASFLLTRIEADRPSEHRVLSAHPRVITSDTGLATWAARGWSGELPAALTGSLFETQVAHDLLALADADSNRIVVRHWRDNRKKVEVDLLLVHPDGRYVPVEVKASTSVRPDDAKGLLAFADRVGQACEQGVLVYGGSRVIDLTPRNHHSKITAVPFSQL